MKERPLLMAFVTIFLLLAYSTALIGGPIWDDNFYIFWSYQQFIPTHAYIWQNYLWPFFDSTTLILYQIFKTHTVYWHAVAMLLHLSNGLLLYRLVRLVAPAWALAISVIFLFHPLNVLSVAWIIQLKTLLCGFFALLSVWQFYQGQQKRFWWHYLLSLLFFFFSVSSKSMSLPLPWLALLLILMKKSERKNLLLMIPFLGISLFSALRIGLRPHIQDTIRRAEVSITRPAPVVPKIQETAPPVVKPPKIEGPAVKSTPVPETPKVQDVDVHEAVEALAQTSKAGLVFQNLLDYIGRPWWPWPLSPIQGSAEQRSPIHLAIGAFVILLAIGLGWLRKTMTPVLLILGQVILLIPVLGIVPVPHLSYSALSEQHFYLTLPLALGLILWVVSRFAAKYFSIIAGTLVAISFALTLSYTPSFYNEETFHRRAIRFRPHDCISNINLVSYLLQMGQGRRAKLVLESYLKKTQSDQRVLNDPLYPTLLQLRSLVAAF